MPRFLLFSDLHLDIGGSEYGETYLEELSDYLRGVGEYDYAICAGDISPSLQELENGLKYLKDTLGVEELLFVPGNHDVWEIRRKVVTGSTKAKYETFLKNSVERAGCWYLPRNPFVLNHEVGIIGNLGWYDYSFRNPFYDTVLGDFEKRYQSKQYGGLYWNDAFFTNWGMSDAEVVEYLLEEARADAQRIQESRVSVKVAVFHHIPFKEGVIYKNTLEWDFFSAFMGSEKLGWFVEKEHFNLVIHGHTHFPRNYEHEGSKVLCCPIGYPNEWQVPLRKAVTHRARVLEL